MMIKPKEEGVREKYQSSRGRYVTEFEQLELIGEGGFGKVYRVRHLLDDNIYAIKKTVVNCEDPQDKKMLKEVALLSKLNHPNIVRYYQSWLEDTHSFQELADDMSFTESSKIDDLNKIYKNWKSERAEIKFAYEESS